MTTRWARLLLRTGPVLARKIAMVGLVVLATVALAQSLLALAPGDAIDNLDLADEVRPQLEQQWRLDQPLHRQISSYVIDLARGDLRESLTYRPGTPVIDLLKVPAWRSAWLLIATTLVATCAGFINAVLPQPTGPIARLTFRIVGTLPVFLLARLAVDALNVATWGLMSAGAISRPGWFALPIEDHPFRWVLAVTLLAVGSGTVAEIQDECRARFIEVWRSGYIDATRARGADPLPSLLRNLAPALATITASRIAHLLGGLVVIEQVLLIHGAGAILWRAALTRDYPVVLGITVLATLIVVTARFAADALRWVIDPRRRERP